MRTIRNISFIASIIIIIVCAVLLITAFDPTNPTNRRYSSETVITTGSSQEKGNSGENVLARDIDLLRNELQNPKALICNPRYENEQKPPRNTACLLYSNHVSNYRIPDFISPELKIIADSKNASQLVAKYGNHDFDQISEFSAVANEIGWTVWIYVRQNTIVDEAYNDIVGKTGGRVIHYFQTEVPMVTPTDFWSLGGIVAGLSVIVISTTTVSMSAFIKSKLPNPQPKSPITISEHRKSRKARQSFEDYDKFMRDAKDNARRTLDDD